MSEPRRNPIEVWGELSARAARAGAVRDVRTERPRAAAAAAGLGVLTLAVVVVGAALVLRPGVGPAADRPVTTTTDDGMFRITLTTPRRAVTTNDAIEPVATLTYLGPEPAVVVSGAAQPFLFSIQEVAGSRSMPGGARLACVSTTLDKDRPLTVPFAKAGMPTSDASAGFDQAWYQEKTLRLPSGTWRITATLSASTGGCAGTEHPLAVTNEITVTQAAPNADPVVREVDDGVFRLRLSTPHGIYGPTDPIEPVATVTYLGPNPTETMWHAASPVYFTIDEVGGDRRMDGAMPAPCLHTEIQKASPIDYAFRKSGTTRFGFDAAWYADPVLRLPVGVWRIRAALAVETTDGSDTCGGIGHGLELDNVIVVVGNEPSSNPLPTAPAPTPRLASATPTSTVEPSPSPTSTPLPAGDGSFRLELTIPKDTYATDEVIEPVATLTYLGPADRVAYGHASPAVFFTIEQLDGDAQMTGGADDVCNVDTIGRAEPIHIPFHKSGQIGLGFDVAWFRDPVLRLPPGRWRISAQFEGSVPACESGGHYHELQDNGVVEVR